MGQKISIPANALATAEIAVVPEQLAEKPKEDIAIVRLSKKERLKAELAETNQSSVAANPTAKLLSVKFYQKKQNTESQNNTELQFKN